MLLDVRWSKSDYGPWADTRDCGGVPAWRGYRAFATMKEGSSPAGCLLLYTAKFGALLHPTATPVTVLEGRLMLIPLPGLQKKTWLLVLFLIPAPVNPAWILASLGNRRREAPGDFLGYIKVKPGESAREALREGSVGYGFLG